ncbi:MAG: response regulator [Synergistaceae bacterium]|nr:response regulator [Synergistaceae bacterium]
MTKKTIFVVDDSDANLEKAKKALQREYRVFTFPSAEKMFSLLEKITPDMILLDIEMPGISGFDAIALLKKNHGWDDIPVLFLTGWSEDMVISQGLKLGALDFVNKPFSIPLLLKRVENYLALDEFLKRQAKMVDLKLK